MDGAGCGTQPSNQPASPFGGVGPSAHPRALSKILLAWAKEQPQWAWEDELGTDRLSWEDAPPEVDVAREGVKGDAVLHSVLEELDPLTADLVQLLAEEFPTEDAEGESFDAID